MENELAKIKERVKEIEGLLFDNNAELTDMERKSLETELEDLMYHLE